MRDGQPSAARWLPTIDSIDVIDSTGELWPDGWSAREVSLACRAGADVDGIEVQAWNPDWCSVYAGNVVTVAVDDAEVTTGELHMGELFRLKIDRPLRAGQAFRLRIRSTAARQADALDGRERGIVLSKVNPVASRPAADETAA